MKQKNIIIPIILCSLLLLVISGVNYRHNLIIIPKGDAMVSRHIDFITISTVFVGFSFTALGMLLGLSSENLIEKIKNTCILMDKVGRIICSIVFFIISVAISLLFVLGVNPSNFMSEDKGLLLDGMFYVWCVGCLIVGIFYFIYSVYELYDLIKRVYGYNKKEIEQKITVAEEQMNRTRKKLRENDIYQD